MVDKKVEKKKDDTLEPILQPVQLVSEDERLQFTVGASTFYYRRLSGKARTLLMAKYTKRNNLNVPEYTAAALRHCVLGWDGVNDGSGQPVEFAKELVDQLPDGVTDELADRTGAAVVDEEQRAKN